MGRYTQRDEFRNLKALDRCTFNLYLFTFVCIYVRILCKWRSIIFNSVNNYENDYLGLSDHPGVDESTLPKLSVEFAKSNEPTLHLGVVQLV